MLLSKNEDIETLRAVAIIFTLIVHLGFLLPISSPFFHWVSNNFDFNSGVDLFFVISGFVIANSLISSDHNNDLPKFKLIYVFWVKRVYRLLPSSILWLGILLLYFSLITNDIESLMIPFVAALFNIMNFYSAHCSSNPGDTAYCGIYYMHGHYWSLSLEEQFYIVFPFILFFLNRKLFIAFLGVAIISQFFWQRPFWTYGWFFRTDALCWGFFLALISRYSVYVKAGDVFSKCKSLMFCFFMVLIFCLAFISKKVAGFGGAMETYGVALVAFISAVMVWVSSYDKNYFSFGFGFGFGIRKIILYIGSRSYALYITHLILFSILKESYIRYETNLAFLIDSSSVNYVLFVVGISLTFVLSELTYRFVESPMRDKGRLAAKNILSDKNSSSTVALSK